MWSQKNTSCQVTHHAYGYGETQGGFQKQTDGASPSYHGRRGATGEDANSVTWHIGTTAPGDPMPPHTSAKGVQATRATMVTEHTRLTIVTDTGPPPMPLFACRFHPHSFPSVPFGFTRGPFLPPMQLSPRLHHLEDARYGDLIGLATPEERRGFPFTCCQDDAYRRAGCRKRGGPSSPERLQSALVCILVA